MTLRVLLVEDHPLFREALRSMLEGIDEVAVVDAVETAEEAVGACRRERPDVVIMDLALRSGTGIQATAAITREVPGSRVLVLTSHDDDSQVYAALRAGAHGYLLKTASAAEIVRAVHAVADGDGIFAGSVLRRITTHMVSGGRASAGMFPQLTMREREILDLMAQGRSNTYIADHFVLSLKTVRNHVSNIVAKIGASDRGEAIVRAREAGLGQDTR